MHEAEKDRILGMVADGTLRPDDATRLLAALAELDSAPKTKANGKPEPAKSEPPTVEFKLQRPDGTHTTVQVPANLFPMLIQVLKVTAKESLRSAGQDLVDGTRIILRKKAKQMRDRAGSIMNGRPDPATIEA